MRRLQSPSPWRVGEERGWGAYTVLEEALNVKIKRIVVKLGAALSLQMHYHRSEHWVVVSGTASIVNDDKDIHACQDK